jgi:uncharacterized protein
MKIFLTNAGKTIVELIEFIYNYKFIKLEEILMPKEPVMKVFIAGEGGVGKTTMVERTVKGIFNANTIMTIGVGHQVKHIKTSKGHDIQLQIWDLGGEDRFRFILPMYIKGSIAGMVVFDTTRYSSFKNLYDGWMETIRETVPDIPLVLIGTKTDLPGANCDQSIYQDLIDKFKIDHLYFTSSKTGEQVEDAFQHLADYFDDL